MNKEAQDELFSKICDNYILTFETEQCGDYNTPITLTHLSDDDEPLFEDTNHNRAYCAYDEIYISSFDNLEHRLISFFHELGHIDDQQSKRLGPWEKWDYYHFDEASAWRTGIRLAKDHGITFSEDTLNYAKESLSTYFQDNPLNSEKTHIEFLNSAIEYAFS